MTTQAAGKIARLNVLRIRRNCLHKKKSAKNNDSCSESSKPNVLIFDLSSCTFDVLFLTMEDGLLEVCATDGNTHLDGQEFDNKLVEYFVNDFRRKYKQGLQSSPRSVRRLRTQGKQSKLLLPASSRGNIEIDALYDDIDNHSSITSAKFAELCKHEFEQCSNVAPAVLRAVYKSDIDNIVLVGGSTIPRTPSTIKQYFTGQSPHKYINVYNAYSL